MLADRIKRPGQRQRDKSLALKRTHVMRASLRRFKHKIQQKSNSLLHKSLIEYEQFDRSNCENEYETGYARTFASSKGFSKSLNAPKRLPFSEVNAVCVPSKAGKILPITASELQNAEMTSEMESPKNNGHCHRYPALERGFEARSRSGINSRTATIRRPMPCLNSRRFYSSKTRIKLLSF